MGVCMVARAVRDEKIMAVLAAPPLVWRLVEPENTDAYLREIGQSKPPGFLARLFGDKREWPPKIPGFDFVEEENRELDLDKSWDGINFCLKRVLDSDKCPNLFEDGRLLGKVEIGYGSAMCFDSNEVRKISDCYSKVSEEELLREFAPGAMTDVYLHDFWCRDDDDCREYLTEHFSALKAFLGFASEHNLGIVITFV